MRKFSQVEIVVSHTDDEKSVFSAPNVILTSGNKSVQVSNFESALRMLPSGSYVNIIANGTVGNTVVHGIAKIIREGNVFVSLDLSSVSESSRVFDSPFRENQNIIGVIFPNNLASINNEAFAECTNLETVRIPASVKKIGIRAFSGCEKLTSMEFEDCDGWSILKDDGSSVQVSNLTSSDDNPYRFTLPSSPYRNCILQKE